MKQFKTSGWFLPLRLAQYIILFAVVVFWLKYPQFMHGQFILYSVITLLFTGLVAMEHKFQVNAAVKMIIGLQFLFELLIESSIIYATGNINSPFSILFILTIISAALVYRLIGSLVIASVVSASYAFIIWLGFGQGHSQEITMETLETIYSVDDLVFYSIFIQILIFYLIAFISGYLSERINISDQQLAVTSRELKKARLETDDILRNLNSGLLTIDAEGKIIFFNRTAENILGYKEELVRGLSVSEVFAERMPSFEHCLLDCLVNHINQPRYELYIINKNKTKIPIGVSTSVLKEENGQIRGVIAIFSDLTDVKKLEKKVRANDRLMAVGEMSASIAHEIRNPLAAISGSVQILKSELKVEESNEKLMSLIIKESDRLTSLLNDFLSYSRIDKPNFAKIELCHLITEVVEILYHHPRYNDKITINIEADKSIVYVIGDEGMLKQLLINLATNALEAIDPACGVITIQLVVHSDSGSAELFISDNGSGMSPEIISSIYKPFFSTKDKGTGLGLAIVHRICSALKIPINISSQPAEGTSIVVELPLFESSFPQGGDASVRRMQTV